MANRQSNRRDAADPKEPHQRSLRFERGGLDLETRTVPVSVSSDTSEILRYVSGYGYGYEILDHSSGKSIDLSRFKGDNGGPALFNHNRDTIIGRFMPSMVKDGVLRGTLRFAKNPDGERAMADVADGILTDTSINYDYDSDDVVQVTPDDKRDYPTYRIMLWALNEISLVTVPADPVVGVGRNHQSTTPPAVPAGTTREEGLMTPEEIAAALKAAQELRTSIPGLMTAERAAERTAVIQLRNLAVRYGIGKEVDEFLTSAQTVDQVKERVFALLQERGPQAMPPPKATSEDLGLTEDEQKRFSVGRAIRALVSRDFSKAGFEVEVSKAMSQRLNKDTPGFFVPNDFKVRNQRVTTANVLQTIVPAQGGAAVFTEYAGWLQLLRNRTRVFQMGAQLFAGLRSNYSFVRQTAAAQTYWISENSGADVTDSTIAIQNVTMKPHILKGMLSFTAEQLAQAEEMFDALCNQELLKVHSIEIDRVALNGSGASGQPTGVLNQAGIGAVAMGTNGLSLATLGVQPFIDLETAVATANADLGNLAYLTDVAIRGECKKTLEFIGVNGSNRIWQNTDQKDGSGTVNGYYAAATNNLPNNLVKGTSNNCRATIFANWADLYIGEWGGGLELVIDPYTLAGQDITRVISRQLIDVALGHPGSFSAIKDLL